MFLSLIRRKFCSFPFFMRAGIMCGKSVRRCARNNAVAVSFSDGNLASVPKEAIFLVLRFELERKSVADANSSAKNVVKCTNDSKMFTIPLSITPLLKLASHLLYFRLIYSPKTRPARQPWRCLGTQFCNKFIFRAFHNRK